VHLYLIRHGQSYVNLRDWPKGNTDEGLTDLGKAQAERLGAWLPTHIAELDAIYCSTMKRARETVAAIAGSYKAEIQFDDRLREIGNNRLDHSPWPNDALPKDFADYWASARPFSPMALNVEAGESHMHFRTRVGIFVEELVDNHRGQHVAVVAHGGVVEAVFDHVFNIGPWRRCEVWDHNTAVTHFECIEITDRETWRLHYHNRVEHLIGLDV
jgi:2,3-bisphosphoglycerate-dependent phosphoglycerate mutase